MAGNRKIECSECDRAVAKSAQALKCTYCAKWFHVACVELDKEDYLFMLRRQSLGFRWFCVGCMIEVDDLLREDRIASALEKKLTDNVLSVVSDAMSGFSEKLGSLESKIEGAGNIPLDSIAQSQTFTNIVKKTFEESKGETEAAGVRVRDHGKIKTIRHQQVLVIKPRNGDIADGAAAADVAESIKGALHSIPVESCRETKAGGLVVKFPSEEAKGNASDAINSCLGTDSIFSVTEPRKMLPKMTVTDVPTSLPDGDIIPSILKKNASIEALVERGCVLSLIFTKTKNDKKLAVVRMSPEIRMAVVGQGNYIFVGLSRCQAYDRFWVTQCYHCQGFGHIAEKCSRKDDLPRCAFCAGTHKSK